MNGNFKIRAKIGDYGFAKILALDEKS